MASTEYLPGVSGALLTPLCPKCGAETDRLQYHDARSDGETACTRRRSNDWISRARGAHLHATCRRCNYDWPTPALDEPTS